MTSSAPLSTSERVKAVIQGCLEVIIGMALYTYNVGTSVHPDGPKLWLFIMTISGAASILAGLTGRGLFIAMLMGIAIGAFATLNFAASLGLF